MRFRCAQVARRGSAPSARPPAGSSPWSRRAAASSPWDRSTGRSAAARVHAHGDPVGDRQPHRPLDDRRARGARRAVAAAVGLGCRCSTTPVKEEKAIHDRRPDVAFVRPRKPSDRQLAYAESFWICTYVDKTYGRQKILDMLEQFRLGRSPEETFQSVLGRAPRRSRPSSSRGVTNRSRAGATTPRRARRSKT